MTLICTHTQDGLGRRGTADVFVEQDSLDFFFVFNSMRRSFSLYMNKEHRAVYRDGTTVIVCGDTEFVNLVVGHLNVLNVKKQRIRRNIIYTLR